MFGRLLVFHLTAMLMYYYIMETESTQTPPPCFIPRLHDANQSHTLAPTARDLASFVTDWPGGEAHRRPCALWPRRPLWPSLSGRCAQGTSTACALSTQRRRATLSSTKAWRGVGPRWQRALLRHVARLLAFVVRWRPLATEHLFSTRSRGESQTMRSTLIEGRAMPPRSRATSLVDAWVLEPGQEET